MPGAIIERVAACLRLRNSASGRDIARYPDVATNDRTTANSYTAEYRRACIDYHVVFHYRVARNAFDQVPVFAYRKALGPERDRLV